MFGMAWHDKFKSHGSANFLFHFSLTRYRNCILFTILRQCDRLTNIIMAFYYFSSHHKDELIRGMCLSNMISSKWTVYPIWTQNHLYLNLQLMTILSFRMANYKKKWNDSLEIQWIVNQNKICIFIRTIRTSNSLSIHFSKESNGNGEERERKDDQFGCTCPYFYDAIINTSKRSSWITLLLIIQYNFCVQIWLNERMRTRICECTLFWILVNRLLFIKMHCK